MKKIFLFLFSLIMIILAIGYYAFNIEPKKLTVHDYKLEKNEAETTLKLIQISDIHLSEYITLADLEKIVNRVNELNPDIVVFTGDLIDRANTYSQIDDIAPILKQLKGQKYAIYGNHDIGGGAIRYYENIMLESDITLLRNQYDVLDFQGKSLTISGYDDVLLGNPDFTLETPIADYHIALLHEPDLATELDRKDIDLILSGHSHGGQIALPFYGAVIKPAYAKIFTAGFYDLDHSLLYVNTGIGTTRIHARLFAEPMIAYFEIAF